MKKEIKWGEERWKSHKEKRYKNDILKDMFGQTPQLFVLDENISHQEWLEAQAKEKSKNQAGQIISLNEERGENSLLSVELVREFIGKASLQARQAEPVTYLLLHVERASSESQNALLKILEEPPAGLQILLSTTDITAVLPTIISRCLVQQKQNGGDESKTEEKNITANSALFPFLFWEKQSYGEIITQVESFLNQAVAAQKETVAAAEEETKAALEKRVCRKLLTELTQNYQNLFPQIPAGKKMVLLQALELFQQATIKLQANVSPKLVLEDLFFTLKQTT